MQDTRPSRTRWALGVPPLRRAVRAVPALALALAAGCSQYDARNPETQTADSATPGPAAAAVADTVSPVIDTLVRGGAAPADGARVRDAVDYALDAQRFERFQAATRNLARLPDDRSAFVRRTGGYQVDDPNDIEQAVRRIEGDSDARRLITGAGLTVRDFVLTTLALGQALAAADAAAGPIRFRNVPAANAEFLRAHRAEVERLHREGRLIVRDVVDTDR